MDSSATAYDAFSFFYNKYWGTGFITRMLPILDSLVLSKLPNSCQILDLCCGTGQLTNILTEKGYTVTGIDNAQKLLQFAQYNAPKAHFIHADARAFHLQPSYTAVICLFDSLNHIMTVGDLVAVFKNVHAVLLSNTSFIFDLNMEKGYHARWKGSFGVSDEKDACIVKSKYDPNSYIATMDATLFQLIDEKWQRSDIIFYQRCYSENEIKEALYTSGFKEVKIYDAERDFGLHGNTGRSIFVANKL